MKISWVILLAFSINYSQERIEFESTSMYWVTGYEITCTGNQIDSIRYWNGSVMNSPPDTILIMGGVPSRKTLSNRATLYKWKSTKMRFEQALEKIRVTGFHDINNQRNLMEDGVSISDGWSINYNHIKNGKQKTLRYHCPNVHLRREDQIVARVWDILKEADPSLASLKTSESNYNYGK